MKPDQRTILVIGAGISGLTVAYRVQTIAQQAGWDVSVKVLEASQRTGGLIESKLIADSVIETGPEAFRTEKPAALRLAEELDLTRYLVQSPVDLRTKVFWNKQLHELPVGFMSVSPTKLRPLLETSLFSMAGKARMCCDLFLPPGNNHHDESLADFVLRRFGRECLERVVEPLISGVFAGNPYSLSAASTVPKLCRLESEHGSIIKGLLVCSRGRGQNKSDSHSPSSGSLSFNNGLQQLTDRLEQKLKPATVLLGMKASKVTPGFWKQWRVVCSNSRTFEVDEVVFATPSTVAGEILSHTDHQIGSRLQQIQYSRTIVLNALFSTDDIDLCKGDSGFVVPDKENPFLRACTFSTNKFAKRIGAGLTSIRLYARTTNPEILKQSDQEVTRILLEETGCAVTVRAAPLSTTVTRHEQAIPQYAVGHHATVNQVERLLCRLPGISLIGNAYTGIGIADCVEKAESAAAIICERASLLQRRHLIF